MYIYSAQYYETVKFRVFFMTLMDNHCKETRGDNHQIISWLPVVTRTNVTEEKSSG